MYKNFAPRLNGRYLSSNVNITVTDSRGNNVSVPVGGASRSQIFFYVRKETSDLGYLWCNRALRQVQDAQVSAHGMSLDNVPD